MLLLRDRRQLGRVVVVSSELEAVLMRKESRPAQVAQVAHRVPAAAARPVKSDST